MGSPFGSACDSESPFPALRQPGPKWANNLQEFFLAHFGRYPRMAHQGDCGCDMACFSRKMAEFQDFAMPGEPP
jgi:hypothetical protein